MVLLYFVLKHLVDKYNLLHVRPHTRVHTCHGTFSATLGAGLRLWMLTVIL